MRPTSSTQRWPATSSTPTGCASLRQSCAGLIWSKQIYPYAVGRWLDGDPAQPPPPPGHRTGRNAGLAPRGLLRRAGHAGPVGVPLVRCVGPRLPHHPVGPPRSGLRQVPAPRAAAGVVPASQRGAARVRVELRRRQPTGTRPRGDQGLPDRRRQATSTSSNGSSRSSCSTSPGGSTARIPTATTSSPVGSSASTTSVRWTDPTCRPTCGSNRPTEQRGWPTTHWPC